MKKSLLLCSMLLLWLLGGKAQQVSQELNRFIEVTGSAEIEIEPDEIIFIIRIKEYWKEEFEKSSKPKDYRTKVPMTGIEKELLSILEKNGVKKENITVREVGNYWREQGKDFLISKELEIKLKDFNTVNKITDAVNTNGIDYMNIGELKNKDIANYRKQAKIEALKAAKAKAEYLLASIGQQAGEVISIIEPQESPSYYGQAQHKYSNVAESMSGGGSIDNIRKIKLRYEITARFSIK